MIYLIHPDYRNYKSFVYDHKAVRKALGSETQFHFARSPQRYLDIWQTFEIGFEALASKKAGLPDIIVRNGRMFLNETAADSLKPLIENHGEFLPVTYEDREGMLFNILATAEDVDGLDTQISSKNEFGEVQALAFHEGKIKDLSVFRTAIDGYMGVYCNEAFKKAVENTGLKGLIFSSDIGTAFPPDKQAKSPSKH